MFVRRIYTQSLSVLVLVLLLGVNVTTRTYAQNVAFKPGLVSLVAGDWTGKQGPSPASYSGPASGLVWTGSVSMSMATDSYGNVYVGTQSSIGGIIQVIASGKGPIPVLPSAGPNPIAGGVYAVAGGQPPCASGTTTPTGVAGIGCPAIQATVSPIGSSFDNGIQGALALDTHNNLFILEHNSEVDVVYSGTGSIPNLSANAQAGYLYAIAATNDGTTPGDDGSALNASFSDPTGISVDSNDNVYVADAGDFAIRVIYESGSVPNLPSGAQAGNIYTIGGSLGNGCPVDANANNNLFGDPCGDNGLATAAELSAGNYLTNGPGVSGVYVDANGNIYVNDAGDYRVRVIYAGGNIPNVSQPVVGYIYTVAGNSYESGYSPFGGVQLPPGSDGPALDTMFALLSGITGDAAGNIYLTDADFLPESSPGQFGPYNAVRRIDPSGNITTITSYAAETCPNAVDPAGDGCPADKARINYPASIGVDSSGNVYVTDYGYQTVLQNYLLHKITVNQTSLTAASTVSRPQLQVVTVTNTGAKPLMLGAITYQGNNGDASFSQGPTGGSSDCGPATSLAPGASCQIGIVFTPESVGTFSGAIAVASNALNATQGVNLIQVAGTATQSITTTNLAIVPGVANAGQQVTLTATVVPDYGSEKQPTGTVTFTSADGVTTLGTSSVTNGVATLQTNSLAAGTHSYIAAYSGDVNYTGSTSFPTGLTVSSTQVPAIVLTASSSAINAGTSVTFTAALTPYSGTTIPTGSVTFQDGVITLGSATLDGTGTATFSTSLLDIGSNSLVAVYSGDAHYATAVSTPVFVAVTSLALLQLTPGIISDVAGVYNFSPYVPNYGGDGGPATAALLQQPTGVATDGYGNVYILDSANFLIRAVFNGQGTLPGVPNPQKGNIYLLAGTARQGCSDPTSACGDGGPAIGALLGSSTTGPTSLTVDVAGNLYVGDGNNYRIRKVSTKGIITTIAGNGTQGYSGDGGPAIAAQLASVLSLAVDNAGDVYFSDNANNVERIRRIDAVSGVITTIAGNGINNYTPDGNFASTSSIAPGAITLDSAGDLYFVDVSPAGANGSMVREIDANTGVLVTVAGSNVDGNGSSGDGGPAIAAQFYSPSSIAVDYAGNLYIADDNNNDVRVVNAVSGIIQTIAAPSGNFSISCSAAPCGDGGLATAAALSNPQGIDLDAQGNLYIADTNDAVIREVPANPTSLNFGSQNQGTTGTQNITVTNAGGTLLILSGLSFSNTSFHQQPSGGTDCTSTTTLPAGAQCQITVGFFPTTTGAITGTLTLGSSASNVSNGQTVVQLQGTGVSLGGTVPQSITFPPLPSTINYGQTVSLMATASSGLPITYLVSGPGKITGANNLTAIGVGAITVTAYQFGQDSNGEASKYAAAAPVPQTTTAQAGETLTVAASDESYIQGTPVPALAYTVQGLVLGDATTGAPSLITSATLTSPTGTYPIVITQGTLQAPAAYQLQFVNGTMHVTGSTPQTISFAPIGNSTYGAAPIPLSATAISGDPVVFAVTSGPARITGTAAAPTLSITGAGAITVTAMSYGDATYKAATPVPQTITVAPAPLTITASNVTITQGEPIPPLNGYSVNTAQLLNGDTTAVLSGAPTLTAAANQNSPVGTYPIVITHGTLTAANYALNFVNGTLTIQQGEAQTVTFPPIANTTYGAGAITLGAGASSNLPVTYTIQPGGGTNLASISGNTLTVTGAGTITVVATQAGNGVYSPASATQTFTVAPAVATITAGNATRQSNTPNPPFTSFTISGLVNGDQNVVSGTPQMTTTAQPGSPAGTYPINIAVGTLVAQNYTFNLVPGVLTVTGGGPTPDFSLQASPQELIMLSGQTRQSVITLLTVNYYQGLVKLSCGSLPTNVTCTFSPATLAPDGTGNPVTTTLTVNTSSNSPVVGALRPMRSGSLFATATLATCCLPGGFALLLLSSKRGRNGNKVKKVSLLLSLIVLAAVAGITACGGGASASPTSSGDAAPGTSTITVTATGADSTSHTVNLSITVN